MLSIRLVCFGGLILDLFWVDCRSDCFIFWFDSRIWFWNVLVILFFGLVVVSVMVIWCLCVVVKVLMSLCRCVCRVGFRCGFVVGVLFLVFVIKVVMVSLLVFV